MKLEINGLITKNLNPLQNVDLTNPESFEGEVSEMELKILEDYLSGATGIYGHSITLSNTTLQDLYSNNDLDITINKGSDNEFEVPDIPEGALT